MHVKTSFQLARLFRKSLMETPCRLQIGRRCSSTSTYLMHLRVETKNAPAVAGWVRQIFTRLHPRKSTGFLDRLFSDVEALFAGRHPDYGAIDLRYHDLEHTLQASVCLAELLEGCQRAPTGPKLSARHFELAIAAIMLHDAGYLKLRSDTAGTGAKYTFCHVLRSCAFAASYLPTLGANDGEISGVLSAINCTGPTKEIGRLHFRDSAERFIGSALASADYLGQMAAPDYPDELGILFAEFAESDDFVHIPQSDRLFTSADDLIARTPGFWRNVVRPKLDGDFQGAFHYLASADGGSNYYIEAVARNIEIIERRSMPSPVTAE